MDSDFELLTKLPEELQTNEKKLGLLSACSIENITAWWLQYPKTIDWPLIDQECSYIGSQIISNKQYKNDIRKYLDLYTNAEEWNYIERLIHQQIEIDKSILKHEGLINQEKLDLMTVKI